MSSKSTFFIANWKMNGVPSDFKEINKVAVFLKKQLRQFKKKVVYCPPISLLAHFFKMNAISDIEFGVQNISNTKINFGAMTGSVSPKLAKLSGAKYAIIGHSERRAIGEDFDKIKKKLILNSNSNLNSIFCIGETLLEKKKKKSANVLKKQLAKFLSRNLNFNNIIFAYEPIWAIGTGEIPDHEYLSKIFIFLNNFLKQKYKIKHPKILYGGSVNSSNIKDLRLIPHCSGYLIGGSSFKAKNFIEIIKNYYN